MDISITGRNLGVTDRFRDYATEKAEKVAKFAPRAQTLTIKVTRQNQKALSSSAEDRVEMTLAGPGPVIRSESLGSDKYAAFDQALAKLLERARRHSDRRKAHHRGGRKQPQSLHEAATGSFSAVDLTPAPAEVLERVGAGMPEPEASTTPEQDDYCPVVIRSKVFASEPMSVDDALYYMELVGHDFYLFIDRETARPSVVYRRKGWDYGLIALDDEADESQEEHIARGALAAGVA